MAECGADTGSLGAGERGAGGIARGLRARSVRGASAPPSGVLLLCLFCLLPAIAGAGDWIPWVTKTSTDSATINWKIVGDTPDSLDYATSSYYGAHGSFEKTAESRIQGQFRRVDLAGLAPDTRYIYRLRTRGDAESTAPRAFRTMPLFGPFTFIVISDSQEGHHYMEEERFKYVADAVAREPDALFILHGGDYARYNDESRWNAFFKVADGMLAACAIFPAIGNHEYHNIRDTSVMTAAEQYRQTFDMPLHYSFDCAGIRFIVLDTPDPAHANGDDPHTSATLAQSQVSWLEERLKGASSGVFTIHHHPVWDLGSSSMNPDLQPWEELYRAYHVSASFSGHTHDYQRFLAEGVPYFIVGTAGGPFAELSDIKPAGYMTGATRQLGYLRVRVDPEGNTATAEEVFVASVSGDDSNEKPRLHVPPVVGDSFTFTLFPKP